MQIRAITLAYRRRDGDGEAEGEREIEWKKATSGYAYIFIAELLIEEKYADENGLLITPRN